jgi:hypothetical protein
MLGIESLPLLVASSPVCLLVASGAYWWLLVQFAYWWLLHLHDTTKWPHTYTRQSYDIIGEAQLVSSVIEG